MNDVIQPGLIPEDQISGALAWLNQQHALIYDGSRTLIWSHVEDPTTARKTWRQSSVSDFRTYYSAYLVADGMRPKSLADYWIMHATCRRYRNVVFDPKLSKIEAADQGALNLWNGFNVEPKPGDWQNLKHHLYFVVADGRDDLYEYILGWMARLVQVPWEPAGTAIVMRGRPGAGKGQLARALGRLLGDHFVHISHTGQLTSRFNGILADALMIFADEAVWAGDRPGEGALKALITEPTLAIERKGREILTVRNHVHLMMASNNEWVAPLGPGDRRFCVVDVSDKMIGDRTYFANLSHEQANGGASAMLYDLLRHDISAFDHRTVPKTHARVEQTLRSMEPIDKWWYECLLTSSFGTQPWGRINRDDLYRSLRTTLEQWKTPYVPTQSDMGRRLKTLVPMSSSGQGTMGQRFYRIPDIVISRLAFDDYIGEKIDWPSLDPDEDA